MVGGRIDLGVLGSTPFVVGAAKGDMVAIGMSMYAGKTDLIVAGKNTGIKSIADLRADASPRSSARPPIMCSRTRSCPSSG